MPLGYMLLMTFNYTYEVSCVHEHTWPQILLHAFMHNGNGHAVDMATMTNIIALFVMLIG